MVFNSFTFLVFFVLFINLYWLVSRKSSLRIRNLFILISSYIFYGWWDWRFLSLIFISSLADYVIGQKMSSTQRKQSRKLLLFLSLFINLGILGFFKYFNFFIESVNELLNLFSLGINTHTLHIILPVGISFYTFQSLSYTIDIFRKKIKPTRDPIAFFAYVAFFPQLVAGPIERAGNLLPQFLRKQQFSYPDSISGLRLVLWGLFKKIVIADNVGILADQLFDPANPASAITTLTAALFFTIQIYADFSGYSDIAIGIARLLGFKLMQNFQTPLFAASLREFWQRWHISLSTWFRDYVYIPLGGNRCGMSRYRINIVLTFLLSGLWHGAAFNFLLWGFLHGLVFILEKPFKLRVARPLKIIFNATLVALLFVPFRSESVAQTVEMISSLFSLNLWNTEVLNSAIEQFSPIRFLVLGIVILLFGFTEWQMQKTDFSAWIAGKSKWIRIGSYYILLLLILLLGNFDVKPDFIYFQF